MEQKTCFGRFNDQPPCIFVKHCPSRKHMACFHPNKKMNERTDTKDAGRGVYCYPLYDDCDCGGYEPEKVNLLKKVINFFKNE